MSPASAATASVDGFP